jgi:hypothetical protein
METIYIINGHTFTSEFEAKKYCHGKPDLNVDVINKDEQWRISQPAGVIWNVD